MYQIWKLMLLVSLLICHLLSKVPGTSSEPPKHFVLVHGACHGAWSWYKVVPLLKSGGHNVTALDLGGSGVDPQQVLRDLDPQMENHYTYDDGPSSPPTTFTFRPMFLSSKLYQLSPPEDSALASMLMRPIRLYSAEDISRVIVLSQKIYGSVNRVFIISEKDLAIKEDIVGWMIRENPPHQVEVIKGSDHMVMMSKPIQLSNMLLCLAKN
ncbi:hypothetical protein GOBAR_AA24188 [Gossypium barbadense]|uniref:AB hydrolase-1 domain-containing protein n=1 Tax=Gossypium barbadense TaxID=3634 RepID=A0A2P5WZH6_GOSBA|nr:hypothetical protein GOBAR_AA24188 [Gossypium barbadense]